MLLRARIVSNVNVYLLGGCSLKLANSGDFLFLVKLARSHNDYDDIKFAERDFFIIIYQSALLVSAWLVWAKAIGRLVDSLTVGSSSPLS